MTIGTVIATMSESCVVLVLICPRSWRDVVQRINFPKSVFVCPAPRLRLLKCGEGKRRKEFAEWYGAWRAEGIIMRNTIYAGNKLTEERTLFSRQFYKSSRFFFLRCGLLNNQQQIEDYKIYEHV